MKKKIAALVAIAMVFGCVVGGSLAWLMASTNEVVNVFTTSDIGITLTETEGTLNGTDREFKMVPGHTITKNPKATVETGSEDCYLFVKIDKSATYATYLEEYEVADGWTKLQDGVYYRVFDSKDATNTNEMGAEYSILKDDKVVVKGTVTKTEMNALTEDTYPKLTFTAYAHQLYETNVPAEGDNGKFTPAEAWANASTAAYATGANTNNGTTN